MLTTYTHVKMENEDSTENTLVIHTEYYKKTLPDFVSEGYKPLLRGNDGGMDTNEIPDSEDVTLSPTHFSLVHWGNVILSPLPSVPFSVEHSRITGVSVAPYSTELWLLSTTAVI